MALSTPNRLIWEYFECLRRLVYRVENSQDKSERNQEIALCLFMSVTIVEAFLNIFFRVIVSRPAFVKYENLVLLYLNNRRSLDYKLKHWPKNILGRELNLQSGIGKDFMDLKEKRNQLMHFTSSHQSFNIPGISIHGLADTSVFDNLKINDARFALDVAEGMLIELFRLRGVSEKSIPHELHYWTGKVPL